MSTSLGSAWKQFSMVLGTVVLFGVHLGSSANEERNAAPVRPPESGLSETARLDGAGGEGVCFSRDGSKILTFGKSDARIWSTKSFARIGNRLKHGEGLRSAHFDAAANKVLTIGYRLVGGKITQGIAKVWNARTGKLQMKILSGDHPWSDGAISPDGTLIATCLQGGRTVRVWNLATGRQEMKLEHKHRIWSLQFDPDGTMLLATGRVNTLWDVRSWEVRATLPGVSDAISPEPIPAFSADGRRLALPTAKTFEVYDLAATKPKKICDNEAHALHHDEYMAAIAISADGSRVATVSTMGGSVWDATTGKPIFGEAHGQEVDAFDHAPAMNRDGTLVVFNTPNAPGVWDVTSCRRIKLKKNEYVDYTACFSPDGTQFAIGGYHDFTSIFRVH